MHAMPGQGNYAMAPPGCSTAPPPTHAHYLTNVLYLLAAQPGGSLEIASVRAELYRAKTDSTSYDTACIEVRIGLRRAAAAP
jgi:hypothetical protein